MKASSPSHQSRRRLLAVVVDFDMQVGGWEVVVVIETGGLKAAGARDLKWERDYRLLAMADSYFQGKCSHSHWSLILWPWVT